MPPSKLGRRQVRAVGPVEQHREVVLLRDVGSGSDHHALDDVTLDVETEDRLGGGFSLIRRLGDLDAARFAATAGLHLRLDHGDAAELLGGCARLGGGVGDDAGEHGHAVLLEQIAGLVFEEIHACFFRCATAGVSMPR